MNERVFANYDQWKTSAPEEVYDDSVPVEGNTKPGFICNFQDLCDYFSANSPADLNRRIYKGTTCGASISVWLTDGQAFHNGDRGFNDLTMADPLHSFTIQTIVEGSEATVDSSPFVVPVEFEKIEKWIEYMEDEAELLWSEANEDADDY